LPRTTRFPLAALDYGVTTPSLWRRSNATSLASSASRGSAECRKLCTTILRLILAFPARTCVGALQPKGE